MITKKPPSALTVLSRMPVAVMSVVAVVDVVAGPDVGFLPLVSLGPAFAGLVGGWRRTAVIGAAALLLCVGLGLYDGLFEGRRGYIALASVAGVTGVGIAAAVMRSRREAELASVRSIAEVAQRVLLRPVPLTAGPLQAAVSYTSAVAEARDETGRFYPLDERAHLLKDPDAHRALEALREDLVQHAAGPPHGDAAMLLLRHHGHEQGTSAPTG
ncbi:SpoIIE family protein phosphatase [Streptomyces sp. HC307]|uniref:SpoIIE family protein phosphatase n=1 Tax=Streptomyces flavusporus TaxID=3385496 RepID=UPI0039176517